MKASDFEFDGKQLSDFGCVIANFGGGKGLETVDGVEITFNMASSLDGSTYHSTSTQYESCLETTIQIAKYSCSTGIREIFPIEYREISRWLNRKGFYKLKFLDESNIDLYHEAAFTKISKIEIDGKLYGLELIIQTNRPHALKEPVNIKVKTKKLYTWEKHIKTENGGKGESTGEYVTSYNKDTYPDDGVKIYSDIDIDADTEVDVKSTHYYVFKKEENVASIFDISHEEGYIYPHTEITVLEDGDLNIYNALEDRNTYIARCKAGEVITMDNPIITTSNSEHDILNDFNYNFFRIANTYENRRNDLVTSLPCVIKVEYSPIVKVGL